MLSSNRLNPMAHTLHNAVFNTCRRSRNQVLYWGPAFVMAYLLMDWANRRSVFSLVSTFARLLGLTGGDASAGTHISTRKRARRRKNVRAPDPSERSNRDSARLTRDVVSRPYDPRGKPDSCGNSSVMVDGYIPMPTSNDKPDHLFPLTLMCGH
jgi:hypothetical protein